MFNTNMSLAQISSPLNGTQPNVQLMVSYFIFSYFIELKINNNAGYNKNLIVRISTVKFLN